MLSINETMFGLLELRSRFNIYISLDSLCVLWVGLQRKVIEPCVNISEIHISNERLPSIAN